MSKFFGFLLGIAVALVGPAMFGVLAADGGIELNAKEMALAYGIGALIFWIVVSYFSGAGALGAALTFGVMIYAIHWIPNRTTNFLNDVPGVTTGMIDGIKQYTLNGVVPILAVISLIYAIQLILQAVQRKRRERAEDERRQREQELAQAQQEAESAAAYPAQYPVAGGDYPTTVDNRPGNNFGNSSYDDLFDEDPTPYPPRNAADEEQTAQYANAAGDIDADGNTDADETVLVPTDKDETVVVPSAASDAPDQAVADGTYQADEADQVDQPDAYQAAEVDQAAEAEDDGNPASKAPTPDEPAAGPAAAPAPETPAAPSPAGPAAPSPAGPGAGTPAAPSSGGPGVGAPAVTPPAPASGVRENGAPDNGAPSNSAAGSGVAEGGQKFERKEEVGQQYRERMDGPELDDTGEFAAFENPNLPEEDRPQAPRIMDLPGQFRPAGA